MAFRESGSEYIIIMWYSLLNTRACMHGRFTAAGACRYRQYTVSGGGGGEEGTKKLEILIELHCMCTSIVDLVHVRTYTCT